MTGSFSPSRSSRSKESKFSTCSTTIKPLVVFRSMTASLFLPSPRVATSGGRLSCSTSLRSSAAVFSAASVDLRALPSAASAALRAFADFPANSQEKKLKIRASTAAAASIQDSMTQIYKGASSA